MRKFVLIVVAVAGVLAAIAVYLVATTPRKARNFELPLSPREVALLSRVPADADAFAFIPSVARLERELLANPVTGEPVAAWAAEQNLPRPWMLGAADMVVWKVENRTGYAIQLDAVRSILLRAWLLFSDATITADGEVFLVNAEEAPRIDPTSLTGLLQVGRNLPAGDALVVQLAESRGAFPPIGRPAVSSVQVDAKEIVIVSRAQTGRVATSKPLHARFPRNAMLSVTFAEPPRILRDLKRLVRADVEALVNDGGSIAVYDVDTGTLLPKPDVVISIPAGPDDRAATEDLVRMARTVGEARVTADAVLVSFDPRSLDRHAADTFDAATWPANRWSVRLDPPRLIPVLERVGDSAGLRFVAPRLHRGARDLRRWIRYLTNARAIEAASSAEGTVEELRVKITSK